MQAGSPENASPARVDGRGIAEGASFGIAIAQALLAIKS